MILALTGGGGFLGWHTRAAAHELGAEIRLVPLGDGFDPDQARIALSGANRVIHLAGVNRGTDSEVRDGNRRLAEQLCGALRAAESPARTLVYAGSTQSARGGVYGEAKLQAAQRLATVAAQTGAELVDLRLPNLFGEHGRPYYNAVTATFAHQLAHGEEPTVQTNRELTLLHAQDAADLLLGSLPQADAATVERSESVSGLLGRLREIARTYGNGEIPNLEDTFQRDLFNTYRSHLVDGRSSIPLVRHEDARGAFSEVVRCRGGGSQLSFSTTLPGISRGDHFHRRKVERFVVLTGRARISLRRLFGTEVRRVNVDGTAPVAVDMPTMWAHRIENTGDDVLTTAFWTNDLFDPARPDTVAEVV